MKTNKWYSIVLMGLVFGACTKETIEPGNGGDVSSNTDETGYVSLSVNLPSQAASRAETFDDGDISEWVVKDATLVLFAAGEGDASEANAVFIGAYDLALNMNIQSSTTDHITSNANIVQKINKVDGGNGDVYALVILNRNGKFSLSGNDVMFGQEVFNGTFSEFSQQLVDNKVTANGILMTNAPLFATNGTMSGGSSQTLTKIPASSIYQTKEDAAIHAAAQIYVEKAVAKVTLNNQATGVLSDTNNPLPYTISGWMLDNTNKHAYLVRQMNDSWVGNTVAGNRFVSSQAVSTGLYRTLWGTDPNYDTFSAPSSESGLNTVEGTAPVLNTKADTTYYCLENTFNTANQTYQSTTRAVVRVVFNGGHDFYLLNDDKTMLYEQGLSAANPLENLVAKALISEPTLNAKIKQSLNAGKTFGEGDVTGLTLSAPDATGASKVTGITLSTADSGKYRTALTFTSDDLNRLNTQLGTLYRYVGGAAYYAVKIRHFTDDQTPAPTAGYTENEHLGRYGVLRNNWYQLTVNSVKLIGAPVVPLVSGNTNPDDTDEQYLSVGIKVLSWAVRTQQVDLQ